MFYGGFNTNAIPQIDLCSDFQNYYSYRKYSGVSNSFAEIYKKIFIILIEYKIFVSQI